MYEQQNYMYGQNIDIDGKNLPPELIRSKASTKAIAFCRRKLRGLNKFANAVISRKGIGVITFI